MSPLKKTCDNARSLFPNLVALVRFEETGHARVAKVGVAEDVPGAVDGGIGQVEAIGPGDSLKDQEKAPEATIPTQPPFNI